MPGKIKTTRSPLNLSNMKEAVIQMAEGNPGAAIVMSGILQQFPQDFSFIILHLDDMNMRGPQIWVGFKYHCNHDLKKFVDLCLARDPAMIETVNKMCASDLNQTAVERGGAPV